MRGASLGQQGMLLLAWTPGRRVGQDPALPADTLLLGDGDLGSLTSASQRFYHVLHVAASAGEHEKVVQVPALHQNPCWRLLGQDWAVPLSLPALREDGEMLRGAERGRRWEMGHQEASEVGSRSPDEGRSAGYGPSAGKEGGSGRLTGEGAVEDAWDSQPVWVEPLPDRLAWGCEGLAHGVESRAVRAGPEQAAEVSLSPCPEVPG
ncbi:hypothetical protein P7K49_022663 [Saguinus oedipus]|uniref:Uncharacterized protein n=1 Tax=Saguinus oedipus TaxID=9490 RepID=A0ABQ9UJF7_SAGOE|nr:hypothetical protein P7K49_022663 [Saguinus oedipus]